MRWPLSPIACVGSHSSQPAVLSIQSPTIRRPFSYRPFIITKHTRQRIDVLYKLHGIIAINKPAGLISQGTNKEELKPGTLSEVLDALQAKYGPELALYPVQRLDKPVTGVLLLATAPQTAAALSRQLQRRTPGELTKKYLAVVRGDVHLVMGDERGLITGWLKRMGQRSMVIDAPEDGGRQRMRYEWTDDVEELEERTSLCQTEWEVLSYSSEKEMTLLRLTLLTGFYHQLRVHCAQVLHAPIIGDTAYGPSDYPANSRSLSETGSLPPLLLHSSSISLWRYRRSGRHKRFRLQICAPPPAEFVDACETAGLEIPLDEKDGGVWVDGKQTKSFTREHATA